MKRAMPSVAGWLIVVAVIAVCMALAAFRERSPETLSIWDAGLVLSVGLFVVLFAQLLSGDAAAKVARSRTKGDDRP